MCKAADHTSFNGRSVRNGDSTENDRKSLLNERLADYSRSLSRRSAIVFNALYLPYLTCASIVYLLVVLPAILLIWRGARREPLDVAMRTNAWAFGRYLILLSWPFIRTTRTGVEHLPKDRPCILVCNHRSWTDIIFCSLIPLPRAVVTIRSWPFRLPVIGWFMRRARYFDVESHSFDEIFAFTRRMIDRGMPFLFFPEGHRSRDGRLQWFHTGPFALASEFDLPVVPVVITGSEKIASHERKFPRPGRVRLDILEPIEPGGFEGDKRALRLKRRVEEVFRRRLGE